MPSALAAKQPIDWNPNFIDSTPLFTPLKQFNHYFSTLSTWPELTRLNGLLIGKDQDIATRSQKTIRFVPQTEIDRDIKQSYEARIYLTGEIPTRTDNWHDFFNALVWKTFPHTKSSLNQIHYQAQQYESSHQINNRCRLRDAVTLFDESGVIVVSSEPDLLELLKNFEWKSLFWQHRTTVRQSMHFFIFGHGLYEKALRPYTGMTGKSILFETEQSFFTLSLPAQLKILDAQLAACLSHATLTPEQLAPVPVLGYPGWHAENITETYYDNKTYFRNRPQRHCIVPTLPLK